MFSSRFHWDAQPNRLTRALAARQASGQAIFDLTESNPTHAGLDYPSSVMNALADPALLSYDPAPAGLPSAREAVSAYYAARGISVPIGRILLTASTSEAYAYLFKLLADPGDDVLVPRPSYPLFEFLATMESVQVRPYSLAYQGTWGIDLPAVEAALTPRTRAIVLVNPNNPTGSFVKRAELGALVNLCRDRDLALISDEVFSDYAFLPDPDRISTVAAADGCLTFAMSGLSKAAGLPQMKLGWLAVNGPSPRREEALAKLEWIADTYLSVSTPVQIAAARLLAAGEDVQRQIRERAVANLALARTMLQGSPANLLHVEGGWYITLHVPRTRSEEEWALALLEQDGVLVQPGFFYDFQTEPYLVVSLLTAPAVFTEGLTRLRRALSCYPHSR
jgi:aspartate/methionine/tyrosine aminotransferase